MTEDVLAYILSWHLYVWFLVNIDTRPGKINGRSPAVVRMATLHSHGWSWGRLGTAFGQNTNGNGISLIRLYVCTMISDLRLLPSDSDG